MSDFEQRFGGIGRLYGRAQLERLRTSRVCVIGIGGVGTWACEALVRSGIGHLTLVDLDDICLTNVNRQLHALDGTIGTLKVEAMAQRIRLINPDCEVTTLPCFFSESTAESILAGPWDCIVDAIDSVRNKCRLIAACRERELPIVTSAGAGGRRDPTQVRLTDLAFTQNDALAAQVRKQLRRNYHFPNTPKTAFGIPCVHSRESVVYPQSDGSVCSQNKTKGDMRLNCDAGFGTATQVTGTFGFTLAAAAIEALLKNQ